MVDFSEPVASVLVSDDNFPDYPDACVVIPSESGDAVPNPSLRVDENNNVSSVKGLTHQKDENYMGSAKGKEKNTSQILDFMF